MIETYAPIFMVEIGGQKLPEDISAHVENFSYDEDEKQMDELSITITKGDLSYVDNPLLQEGKEIRVRWGYVGNLPEVRTCTIKEIQYSFGEDGLIRMDITAYDKRHRMTGRASRQCWKDKKLSEVVRDIAAKHNFKAVVEVDDDMIYDFLSEGAKNDLVFLKELAEDAGCSVWVVNDELHFKPNKINEPVYTFRYREDRDGYLQSFRISSKAEQGKGTGRATEAAGINPMTKQVIRESATQGTKSRTVTVGLGDTSVPEKRTENETPLSSRADESGRVISSPAPTKDHARHVARGKVKSASMKSIEAEAVTIGLPYMKARETIQLENIGKKFSGNWRITKVRHEISNSGYTCSISLSKNDHSGGGSSKSRQTPKTGAKNNSQAKPAGNVKAGTNKPSKLIVNVG